MFKTGAAFMLTPFGENRGSGTVHLPRSLSTLRDFLKYKYRSKYKYKHTNIDNPKYIKKSTLSSYKDVHLQLEQV